MFQPKSKGLKKVEVQLDNVLLNKLEMSGLGFCFVMKQELRDGYLWGTRDGSLVGFGEVAQRWYDAV